MNHNQRIESIVEEMEFSGEPLKSKLRIRQELAIEKQARRAVEQELRAVREQRSDLVLATKDMVNRLEEYERYSTLVLIHELLHIPKNFSGSLVPHRTRYRRLEKEAERLYQIYAKNHSR